LFAVQGWSSVIPRFSAVDFLSFYIEVLVTALMYLLWLVGCRALRAPLAAPPTSSTMASTAAVAVATTTTTMHPASTRPFFDFVDVSRVDLYRDEHEDAPVDKHEDEDEVHARRLRGRARWAWTLYYLVA
jgi:hypothetical protein